MKLCAHTLFKNEERYLWFAVMSVINHVDRVLLWDMGSSDASLDIAKSIRKLYPKKVSLRALRNTKPSDYTLLRQEMLKDTHEDWFMILDGDEIWWDEAIYNASEFIRRKGKSFESLVNRYYNLVGDIYHYQEEAAGRYLIDGVRGHLNIRFINRGIPGLYTARPHGQHGYFDAEGKLIQERSEKKRLFFEEPAYFHLTHMVRSKNLENDLKVQKRGIKYKYEIGNAFALDFYYPEVFFRPRPAVVPDPWFRMDGGYFLKALIQTPPRKIKRRISYGKVGY